MHSTSILRTVSLSLALVLAFGCSRQNAATSDPAEKNWLTDFDAALTQAKKENKPILLDFTGSDWCPPCKLLKKQVFTTEEFKNFAAKNLILVTIDFPKLKPLSPEQLEKNIALAKKYETEDALPTVLIVDPQGRPLGGMQGYDGSAATEYIARLQRILTEKPVLK